MLVQEQAGYRLLPAPFFSTVCLAANLIEQCADEAACSALLPGIAEGELIVSADLPSLTAWTDADVAAERAQDGGWCLSGVLARVPDAGAAQRLLVLARCDDGPGLFWLDTDQAGVACEPLQAWDASRRFASVTLNKATAMRCERAGLADNLSRAAARLQISIAAEQLGAAQRCLDLTLDYVQERKQFGRAVGSFQAVKHRCAEMMVAIEATRSAVYGAAALAAGQPELAALEMEAAAAKALASETLHVCAGEAIQLHGGVGFTWEYDPQLYFKRARASMHWLGDPAALRALVARRLIDEVAA